MKVSLLNSVGSKLFYYMSLLVLITVAGNSFQYIRTFMAYQTSQVQDNIQLLAEKAGSQFENNIETWRSQIAVSLPSLRGEYVKNSDQQLQRYVNSSAEFVGIILAEAPSTYATNLTILGSAFTSGIKDPRFEDKDPDAVWKAVHSTSLSWLKKIIPLMKSSNISIENMAPATKLPLVSVATRFDVESSERVVWVLLVTWQTNLIKNLPKSKFIDSTVINASGRIFTSTNMNDMINRRSMMDLPIARSALSGHSPSGFEKEYKHKNGSRRLGAYFRIPRYGLAVLVETDAEAAYHTLKKNLFSTALWAAFFMLVAVMFSFVGAAGITKGLRAVTYATSRIAAGDFNYRIVPNSRDEVAALGLAVNHMSKRITDLLHSQVDKARFEKELETARMVQSTFFPKKDLSPENLCITGFYQPASECGGDLWGHYKIDKNLEFIFIADAMGHGAPAALVTAMAYSTCMTIADILKENKGDFRESPASVIGRLNRIIYEAVEGKISMTCFAAIIDTSRGILTYANAGHNFPVLIPAQKNDPRSGKMPKSLAKFGEINPISLKLMGTPMGIDNTIQYTEQTIDLRAGDKIFLFTDGLIECTSPDGGAWGRKHLLEQIVQTADFSAESLKQEIVGRAFNFFAKKPIADDITVVVVELDKVWEAAETLEDSKTNITLPNPPQNTYSHNKYSDINHISSNEDSLDPSISTHVERITQPTASIADAAAEERLHSSSDDIVDVKSTYNVPDIPLENPADQEDSIHVNQIQYEDVPLSSIEASSDLLSQPQDSADIPDLREINADDLVDLSESKSSKEHPQASFDNPIAIPQENSEKLSEESVKDKDNFPLDSQGEKKLNSRPETLSLPQFDPNQTERLSKTNRIALKHLVSEKTKHSVYIANIDSGIIAEASIDQKAVKDGQNQMLTLKNQPPNTDGGSEKTTENHQEEETKSAGPDASRYKLKLPSTG